MHSLMSVKGGFSIFSSAVFSHPMIVSNKTIDRILCIISHIFFKYSSLQDCSLLDLFEIGHSTHKIYWIL